MKSISRQTPAGKRTKKRKLWIPIVVVLLLAAAGGVGTFLWNQRATAAAQAGSGDVETKTTQVRRGSITLSALGAGTLTAGQERELGFSVSGTLAEVNVQVGDTVHQGQVLARLAEIDELQDAIRTAEQDLRAAQQDLQTFQENAPLNLANAQLDLIAAQSTAESTQSKLVQEGWARCDAETIEAYYGQYMRAKDALDALGDGGGSQDYYLTSIVPAKNTLARAKAAYDYCAGYSQQEIDSAQASHTLAQAEQEQARLALETLLENNGLDPLSLATAENKVANAQYALEQAQQNLAGATITAPFDGTILAVTGAVGDSPGTSAFLTVADLAYPRVEFSVDETDMALVALGAPASVTFDAVPGQTFTGTVIRINPALEAVNGYRVLNGLIALEMPAEQVNLPKGLNGTVEITQASAQDALLVPLQAVRDLGDGSYAVFVVGADNQPRLRLVQVGLMDLTSAEIKEGLSLGEVVTTGIEETQ